MAIKATVWQGKYTDSPLSDALKRLNLDGAGQQIRRMMIEEATEAAFKGAKGRAPVGGDNDPHPGQLRDSLYKEITEGRYLIRGKVAIPVTIPYRFAVIYGDKRHMANRFMEIALRDAINFINKRFANIVHKAFGSARGK